MLQRLTSLSAASLALSLCTHAGAADRKVDLDVAAAKSPALMPAPLPVRSSGPWHP